MRLDSFRRIFGLVVVFTVFGMAEVHGKDSGKAESRKLFLQAVEYLKQHAYEKARGEFQKVLKSDPENLKARFYLGIASYHSRHLVEAEGLFRRVNQRESNMPISHYYLGRTLYDLKRKDEALQELGKAERLDPAFSMVHYYTGLIYYRQGKNEKARQEFKKAIQCEPRLSRARYGLAYLLYHRFHDSSGALGQVKEGLKGNADAPLRAKLLKLQAELIQKRPVMQSKN